MEQFTVTKSESLPDIPIFKVLVSRVKHRGEKLRSNSVDITDLPNTTTSPPTPKSEKRYSNLQMELASILSTKESCKQFKKFLRSKKCDENLYFYIDVSIFTNFMATPNSQMQSKARAIYEKYFKQEAKYPLNLDSEIVKSIDKCFITGNLSREMYTEAQHATYKLMESACIGKYFTEFCLKQQSEAEEQTPKRVGFLKLRKSKSDLQQSMESLNLEAYFKYKQKLPPTEL